MKKFVIIFALGSALGSTAFATANSCGTAIAAPPSGTTNPTSYITMTTANLVDANEITPSATDQGCQVMNKVFDNFAVSVSSGVTNTNGTAVTTASIMLLGTDPATAGIQQLISFSPTTTNLANPAPLGTVATTGIDWSYDGTSGTSQTTTIDFNVTPVLGSGTYGLRGMGIDYTALTGTDQIVILVQACFVQTSVCSSGFDFAQTFTFDPTGTADQTLTLGGSNFTSIQTSAYTVRLTATLTDGSSKGGIKLNNFFVEFQDTPEPATFGMMGAALATLAVMARRRRKV